MRGSDERILVTHVGSLPRPAALSDLLIRREQGEAVDLAALEAEKDAAVLAVVRAQFDAGVDVVNDGEQPRAGFQTYVVERMSGFGGAGKRRRPLDYLNYPAFARQAAARFPNRSKVSDAPMAVAEVAYGSLDAVRADCRRLQVALAALPGPVSEAFLTAPSPGIVATTLLNSHYDSHEAYVFALARELGKEYRAVVEAGLLLQIDAPDLAMERTLFWQDRPLSEYLAAAEMHVAALNEALAGLPRESVRLHCCWGNWDGPHDHDVDLSDILPILYRAEVGALAMEFANPRHQHEYRALAAHPLPSHLLLLPGVIDSTSNYVEHPEVIADRICQAVAAVGDRERVIAGSDCGFGTFAGYEFVAPDVVWAKLASCAEGARRASARLWGTRP